MLDTIGKLWARVNPQKPVEITSANQAGPAPATKDEFSSQSAVQQPVPEVAAKAKELSTVLKRGGLWS